MGWIFVIIVGLVLLGVIGAAVGLAYDNSDEEE